MTAEFIFDLGKLAVQRVRPTLGETPSYWGSSLPSGHTLAISWIRLVALSRLVLGVHWPMGVLAAACIGACLPLAQSVALDLAARPHRAWFAASDA